MGRNLYLYTQLVELNVPIILAMNIKDHFCDDAEVIIAARRYGFISGACTEELFRLFTNRLWVGYAHEQLILKQEVK